MTEEISYIPEAPEAFEEAPKKDKKKTVWIIVAVVAVLLICCCIALVAGVLGFGYLLEDVDWQSTLYPLLLWA
ncbi:MAG: hypothetical protein ACNA70_08280 [Brevefilum sp.]